MRAAIIILLACIFRYSANAQEVVNPSFSITDTTAGQVAKGGKELLKEIRKGLVKEHLK